MKEVLTIIAGIVLTAQALIDLSFLISCLWEKEKKVPLLCGLADFGYASHAVPFPLLDRHRGLPDDPRGLSLGLCACDRRRSWILLARRCVYDSARLKSQIDVCRLKASLTFRERCAYLFFPLFRKINLGIITLERRSWV